MESLNLPLRAYEKVILNLRRLYSTYGYSCCTVSTFEEYDFYARNRSALPGEEVLVFTDADGRLMALKPDVTMSIVKNVQEGVPGLRKLCYNENIYRIPTGGAGFRESVQTGLECIGNLDAYAVSEVLMLALRSLASIRSRFILNLSHVGIVDGLLDEAVSDSVNRTPVLIAMEQKNLPALRTACQACNMAPDAISALETLTCLYGPLKETLPKVQALAKGDKMKAACYELREISELMDAYGLGNSLYLDFSVRGGTDYYSGLVFRGYVDNAASPVLSGGRYDKLISRMGKTAGGIGFAVYLDQLKREKSGDKTQRVMLLYDETAEPGQVIETVRMLQKEGASVMAQRQLPPDVKYDRLMKLTGEGVTEVE